MAKNTGVGEFVRAVTKTIRDGVKANYIKKTSCEVCGCTEDLELHHPHTLNLVFTGYCEERGITVKSTDEVVAMRDDFYKAHWNELVVDVLTLCNTHHKALHKVYGAQPPLSTAAKQRVWVERIRDRLSGMDATLSLEKSRDNEHEIRGPSLDSRFARFVKAPSDFARHILRRD